MLGYGVLASCACAGHAALNAAASRKIGIVLTVSGFIDLSSIASARVSIR
jgi:hypothetical protein